jgi:peptidoglycan hydrolase-like protein with peptidoglycan-binding domain
VMKVRNFAAVVAIGALAALPGCSMFGGGNEAQTAAAAPPPAAPAPAPAPMPSDPQQNALSHSLVRQVQTELKQNQMYSGHVDGIWGPMTRRGVSRYQQKNGLQQTGQLDDSTLQAMHLNAPSSESGGLGGTNPSSMNDNSMSGGSTGGGMSSGSTGGTSGSMSGDTSSGSMGGAPPADTTGGADTGGQAAPAR